MLVALVIFYVCSVVGIGSLMWRDYRSAGFSFHLLFSAIYAVTFYFGFPFSLALHWGGNWGADWLGSTWAELSPLFEALALSSVGYGAYWLAYHWRNRPVQAVTISSKNANRTAKMTAWLLGTVAVGALLWFLAWNGFLLFRLEKYSQIFSAHVSGVALKRFFYFFLPALLIFFFIKESKARWWVFLAWGVAFGAVSYVAVGGTRANLAMAVALFFLLGLVRKYLSWAWLVGASVAMIGAMFGLALVRYRLAVEGVEAWHTFLYLTRDTFSPWENVATIVSHELDFQGLMPIVRDFYVYIPKAIWAERPDIAWNTANYFTKTVLGNQSGLAISPTLIGSFYIMGGGPCVVLGMAVVGGFLQFFDCLSLAWRGSAVVQAFCWGNLFNLIVLVREGSDAFVSRFVFFSVIFGACWLVASIIARAKNADRES